MRNYLFTLLALAIALQFLFYPNTAIANTSSSDSGLSTNRLANAFSPYLHQHASNPVHWYQWGQEAFEKAKYEDKPILLSVGYSTCYWCHVLERETFMQKDAAALMNKNFINVKVDREVRPDIDAIYMSATQLMTGHGGWPNNVILTPDLKPFFAATYLPKDKWMQMNRNIARTWTEQREKINAQANQMASTLNYYLSGKAAANIESPNNFLETIFKTKAKSYDARNGGFGTGEKFPDETALLFLLSYANKTTKKDNAQNALSMVRNTVDNMLAGGIYDHAGGGFHRYATDSTWKVPHFEKMLYTQGLMSLVLARLFETTGEEHYKNTLIHTLHYVEQTLTSPKGVFYSAQDAETAAIEGAYYVWKPEEIEKILTSQEHAIFQNFYDFADLPHIPGHKKAEGQIFHRNTKTIKNTQQRAGLTSIMEKILSTRSKRPAPRRDEKALTAWNGIMIYALAETGRILNNERYIQRARKAAEFLLNQRQNDGKLYRIFIDGKNHQDAFLEDYAWLARGLIALSQATKEEKYTQAATSLIQILERDFKDQKSDGYFMTDGSENLFVRIKMGDDSGALPSGNAVMANVFSALYTKTQDTAWKHKMHGVLNAFARQITKHPARYGHMLAAFLSLETPEIHTKKTPSTQNTQNEQKQPINTIKSIESKDKIRIHSIIDPHVSDTHLKVVKIIIDIEEGWHINANPASMDFLIPTVIDVQTQEKSTIQVHYPKAKQMQNAIGSIKYYEGRTEITATVKSTEKIDTEKMRTLVQLQACHGATCYAPSEITVPISPP